MMAAKSNFVRGFKTKAEKLGESYRSKLGISQFEPLDAYELAKFLSVTIFSVEEIFENSNTTEHRAAFARMSDPMSFSALWLTNQHGQKIIIHNTNHSAFRQQSNLMHELGHIILDHKIDDEISRLCAQFNIHHYNKVHEDEAKYLGGCLQITRQGLLEKVRDSWSIDKISRYFNASTEMVRYRIRVTGVLKQARQTY